MTKTIRNLINKNQDNDIDEEIKFIKGQIKKIGFENTASRYSISASSVKKGDLGWINEKSINPQIYKLIKDLNIGDIAKPIKSFEKAIRAALFLEVASAGAKSIVIKGGV